MAHGMPIRKTVWPCRMKITREVMFVVRLMTFVWPLAVLMPSFAKTVKAMMRKVPVPGP